MKPSKRKLHHDDTDDGAPEPKITFEALAELTSSDVIRQVKQGLSRIEPIDHEEDFRNEASSDDDSY